MKRLFLAFMSLMFIICLAGCNESKEKVNIDFIIDGESHLVQIDKGSSISKDIIPLSNKEEVVKLYYDEDYKNEYNFEIIDYDTVFYIKLTDKELKQIIIDNSYLSGIHTIIINESLYSSSLKIITNEEMNVIFEEFFVGKKLTNCKERIEFIFNNSFNNNHYSMTFNGNNPFLISILSDGTIMLFINENDIFISESNEIINLDSLKERLK